MRIPPTSSTSICSHVGATSPQATPVAPSGAHVERDRALGGLVARRAAGRALRRPPPTLTLLRRLLALLRREAADCRDRSGAVRRAADRLDRLHDQLPAEAVSARWRTRSAAARASGITSWRQTCTEIIQQATYPAIPPASARSAASTGMAPARWDSQPTSSSPNSPPKPLVRRMEYAARGCAETLIAVSETAAPFGFFAFLGPLSLAIRRSSRSGPAARRRRRSARSAARRSR